VRFTDDVLVLDGLTAFSGPRSIDGPRLRPLEPHERYTALIQHLRVHREGRLTGQGQLLELLALPAFELVRPRRMDSLPGGGSALLELAEHVARDDRGS
jgi:hypothetical protein